MPLFVAVDALGVLPIFISLTDTLPPSQHRRVQVQSLITASAVGLGFLAVDPTFLIALNITVPDFMVAGGILLLVISLNDLLTGEERQRLVAPETWVRFPSEFPSSQV